MFWLPSYSCKNTQDKDIGKEEEIKFIRCIMRKKGRKKIGCYLSFSLLFKQLHIVIAINNPFTEDIQEISDSCMLR